ncbi:hypothetical protein ABZ413_05450 [Nocardia rhamnosiphila]|uniref:hypothetical protein n=1 Tax=Nocardia rhamnosiphila TaxID=426716 RepID=UPI0033F7B88F
MRLSVEFVRLTGRLRASVIDAGGSLKRRMHGIANDVRTIADNLVTADSTAARAVSRAEPDTPRLFGQSLHTGLPQNFTPDQVRSFPILDADKKIIGVHFPSKLNDSRKPWIFTREGLEFVRKKYYQYTREKRGWTRGRAFPAPWAGEETVFSHAHADKNGYYVQVGKKIPFTKWRRWVPTKIDGETFGLIEAANEHFKRAVKGAPTAHLIQMSCSPARGPVARESAASLHSAGIGSPVHATENAYLWENDYSEDARPGSLQPAGDIITGHGSEVEIDEVGEPVKSPWSKYKESRQPPETDE